MPAISKFLFETSFEAQRPGDAPPPRPRQSYPAAEVEGLREAAHADGVAAGIAQAMASIEAAAADTLANIGGRLEALTATVTAQENARTRELVGALGVIAKKLVPGLIERHGLAEIETLLGECLARLHDEPRIVVRVADATLDALRPRLDALAASIGFTGRIIAIGDPALPAGDARIEWADGGAERDSARAWADIDSHIARFLDTWPEGRAS